MKCLTRNKRALVYTDKYIEFGMTLPTQILFGLGPHNSKFLLEEGNWTLFNTDRSGSPIASGEGNQNLYATNPFLIAKTADNKFEGVLFYNSNGQQFHVRFAKTGQSVVTYRTIGGILDIYFFTADTADNVIKQYVEMIGTPVLPPFWALGFHQSSWSYSTTEKLKRVVENYVSKDFMFDSIWVDINYMEHFIDFTVDSYSFAGLKKYVEHLHRNNHHFVPIIDAGIAIKNDSKGMNWYDIGNEMNVFIKSARYPKLYDGNLIAKAWPEYVAFVDFFHPNSTEFWSQGLQSLYKQTPFDGIWLDLNEPTNFCADSEGTTMGECHPGMDDISELDRVFENKQSPSLYSSFIPGVDLADRQLSIDSIFTDSNENLTGNYIMYNTHNLYATQMTMATYEYLISKDNKRPFVISRSNFVGHGKYGTTWTGDSTSVEIHMRLSINQIMKYNQFGMPFAGADVCGFYSKATPELCSRWVQVGAFYPFMRNHCTRRVRQEFYSFKEQFAKGMKESLRQRYSLLRNYYTELYQSSRYGYPTVRHPIYDWPEIDEIIKDENSFMIGKNIRVVANFALDDKTPLKTYMPKGRWLDYHTYILLKLDRGNMQEIYNGWDHTNVHIRGGSIIPFQDTSIRSGIKNTHDLLESPLKLLIVPNDNHYADGNLYIARGETTNETFQYFSLIYSNKSLQIRLDDGHATTTTESERNEILDEIQIVDDDEQVLTSDFACAIASDHNTLSLNVTVANKTENGQSYLKIYSTVKAIQFDEIHAIVFGITGLDQNICDRSYYAASTSSTNFVKSYRLKKGNNTTNDKDLTLTLKLLEHQNIHLTITDGSDRFIVPKSALKDGGPNLNSDASSTIDDYVKVSNSTTKFTLQIHEFQNPDSVYFEIDQDSLIFSDYYLSIDTEINSNGKIYGMGERVANFFIQDGIYTSWAIDQPAPYDDGKQPAKNIYGVHPVYFTKSKTGNTSHWGMFNLNANAQDTKVHLNSGKHGSKISHYISGQGVFDMYFFIDNPTPEDAVK